MRIIRIVDFLETPLLFAPDKGERVRKEIERADEEVVVDFEGYQFVSSTFLNHAFGQLCIDKGWPADVFSKRVKIQNLQEDDVDELSLAIDNAAMRLTMIRNGIDPKAFFATHLPA